MGLLGAFCVAAVGARPPAPAGAIDRVARRRMLLAASGTYLLLISGSLVVGSAASGACNAWPLCGGGFSLTFDGLPAIQLLHRVIAGVVGLLIILSLASVLARHRRHAAVRATVALTLATLAFQVVVGAAVVTFPVPAALRGLHPALASP